MNKNISDFKAKLYKFQLKVENEPSLYIFIIVIYSLVTIVATIYEFFVAITFVPKIIIALILLTLIALLLYIDSVHMKMLKSNRFNLDERKRLIKEIISTQELKYKEKYRREFFDIEPDGDCQYIRETTLDYDGVDIAWAEVWVGTTNQYGADFSNMILRVNSYPDGDSLSRVPIQETGTRLRYAVILKRRVTFENRNEGYQLSMKWVDVWTELVKSHKDNGTIRVDHDTEKLVYEILLPRGYKLVNFRVPRARGIQDNKSVQDRQLIVYTFNNLKMGEQFDFFIEVEKNPN